MDQFRLSGFHDSRMRGVSRMFFPAPFRVFLILGVLLNSFGLLRGQPTAPMTPRQSPPQATPIPLVDPRPATTAIAESTSGTMTIAQLQDYVKTDFVEPL